MVIKQVKEVVYSETGQAIRYEWVLMQEALNKHYVAGMYSSLDRICKLFRQKAIEESKKK